MPLCRTSQWVAQQVRSLSPLVGVVVVGLIMSSCSSGLPDVVEANLAPTVIDDPVAKASPLPTTEPVDTPGDVATPTPLTVPTSVAASPPEAEVDDPAAAVAQSGDDSEAAPTVSPADVAEEPGADPAATPTVELATATPVPSAPAPPPPAAPSASNEVLIANGGEVYTLNCARCHGENGLGNFQYSGIVGVGAIYTQRAMVHELTNGHPVTFGFAHTLSPEEIESVVAYVLSRF